MQSPFFFFTKAAWNARERDVSTHNRDQDTQEEYKSCHWLMKLTSEVLILPEVIWFIVRGVWAWGVMSSILSMTAKHYWDLAGKGWWCWTSCTTWGSPTHKNFFLPKVQITLLLRKTSGKVHRNTVSTHCLSHQFCVKTTPKLGGWKQHRFIISRDIIGWPGSARLFCSMWCSCGHSCSCIQLELNQTWNIQDSLPFSRVSLHVTSPYSII